LEKFKGKYRIESARLQDWDYGWNAMYFITICTQNREFYFGDIADPHKLGASTMQLTEIGEIALKYWNEIPKHFPFVELDEFVVMPNHVHGIIVINKTDDGRDKKRNDVETPNLGVSTNKVPNTAAASKKWNPATLGVIINQYKRICTINARKLNPDFAWQSRFYDHIIRDDQSFQKIRDYIYNNPITWTDDKFHNNMSGLG